MTEFATSMNPKSISLPVAELRQLTIQTVDASNVGAEPADLSENLCGLLVEIFENLDTLASFLRSLPDGPDLMALLSPTWELKRSAYEAVLALQRRGMVDREFFASLKSHRPEFREQIDRVARDWC